MSSLKPSLRDAFFVDPFFSVAWDDFDRVHRDLVRDAHGLWGGASPNDAPDPAKRVKVDEDSAEKAVGNASKPNPFLPRRGWMLPRLLRHDDQHALKALGEHPGGDHQLIHVVDDESKFEVSLDTHDYAPDEVHVEVKERDIHVRGRHETQTDHGVARREFVRSFRLPDGCHTQSVVANVSKDGVLLVTAPKKELDYNGTAIPVLKQDDK